ncbi:MAG: RidA family protein [Thermoproteota archaeon]|nr:RidA family protein [Thermoproteota archaeon]
MPHIVEDRLKLLGLALPAPIEETSMKIKIPFSWIRLHRNRAYISGHGPQNLDGSIAGPFGKVGSDVSEEQAYQCARLATLSILSNLKCKLGTLDRTNAWLVIHGFVNVEPNFAKTTAVINGCSELILQLCGEDIGAYARTAMGVASTPFGLPVVIAAEVEVSGVDTANNIHF